MAENFTTKVDITMGLTTITVTGCDGAEIERIGKLMGAAPALLAACESLLAAQGGEWDRGNCYITRALADELNAAAKATRAAITQAKGSK